MSGKWRLGSLTAARQLLSLGQQLRSVGSAKDWHASDVVGTRCAGSVSCSGHLSQCDRCNVPRGLGGQ
jgi:hypothetical protein